MTPFRLRAPAAGYGLQNSSMTSVRIHDAAEYEAMEERGRYTESGGTLRTESGPLAGRVAHLRESSVDFIRTENEVDGPAHDGHQRHLVLLRALNDGTRWT